MGILSEVISVIWEPPTCVLACVLTPRRWLFLPYREVWNMYPESLLPPLEQLMSHGR